jgi:hypothetical protein
MIMSRRFAPAIALCLSVILVAPAFSQAQKAKQTPERLIDVKKVFGYYDMYLGLPAGDRDGFRMRYRISSANSTTRPELYFVLDNVRTPIEVSPTGNILTMPDLTMFRRGKILKPAGQPSGSISLNLDPIVPLSRSISVSDAINPINDYAAATRRAGPLALLAPKLTGVVFKGVPSGEVVYADGRRAALTTSNGGLIFRPALPAMRGAASLSFPAVPTSVEFAE